MTTTGSTTSIPATTGTAPIGTAPFGTAPTGTGSTGPARRRNRPAPCASPRPPARTERGVGHPLLRIGVTTLGGGRLGHEVLLALAARHPATAAGLTLAPPPLMWAMLRGGAVDAVLADSTAIAPPGTRVAAVTGPGPAAVAIVAEEPSEPSEPSEPREPTWPSEPSGPAALVLRHLVEDLGWTPVAEGGGRRG